jgi:hypothetical protein
VPAGFTYLGQFIDHDMTLDVTWLGDKEAVPTAVENFRTPALDLDSVYELGPDGSRLLYARQQLRIAAARTQDTAVESGLDGRTIPSLTCLSGPCCMTHRRCPSPGP